MLRNVLRAIKDEGFLDMRTMARRVSVEVEDLEQVLYLLALEGYLKKSTSPEGSAHCEGCPLLGKCAHSRRIGIGYRLTEKGNRLLEKE